MPRGGAYRHETRGPLALSPWAHLKDVLNRLPTPRIDELLPHKWQPGLDPIPRTGMCLILKR